MGPDGIHAAIWGIGGAVVSALVLTFVRFVVTQPYREWEQYKARLFLVEKRTEDQDKRLALGNQAFEHEREGRQRIERRLDKLEGDGP